MISSYNPKFHEKIMKKYGRRIWNSYFPNLFFRQDFRSPGHRKINVFVQIKFASHNKIVSEDFSLSSKKEMTHGSSKFPLKLKVFGLKPFKPANGKNVFLNLNFGKIEPQNLYWSTFPVFSFRDLSYPESTSSVRLYFNPAPKIVISREVTGCNFRPSQLSPLSTDASWSGYLNFLSATSTLSDLKSFKPNFLGNDNRVLVSKVRSQIQTLQNSEYFFSRGSNLFFTQSSLKGSKLFFTQPSLRGSNLFFTQSSLKGSKLFFTQPSLRESNLFFTESGMPVSLPLSHEISFDESGIISPAAYPTHPLPTASGFFQKVYGRTLRKNKLKRPGSDISGKVVPGMRPGRGIKGSTELKSSRDSEILQVPFSRLFNLQILEYKSETGMKMIRPRRKQQYSGVVRLIKGTLEKQQIRTIKEKQNFTVIKEKQHKRTNSVLCNYDKNIFKIARFVSECLTHPLTPVLAESGLLRKTQNEIFVKTEQHQLPVQDFSLRGGVPAKRFGTETTDLKTYDELPESLCRIFNLFSLIGKSGKEAVKSLQIRKNSVAERPALRIRKKQVLIERKAEQREGELHAFRKIGSMIFSPFVQYLIQNIREKTAFLFDYKSLTYSENPEMGHNISYQQRKAVFPYYKKNSEKPPSEVRRFSAKETTTGKDIPGEFRENLLIFQSLFPKKAISGLPALYMQQLTSRPATLIRNIFSKDLWPGLLNKGLVTRNIFLVTNNEILRAGVSSYRSAITPGDYKSNRSMNHEISTPNRNSVRNFFAGFPLIFQQYPETIYEARTGILEKTFSSSIVEANKNLKSFFKLGLSRTKGSKILVNNFIRILNCLTPLTHNLTNNQATGFKQCGQKFQPDMFTMTSGGRAVSSFLWQKTPKPESSFFTLNSHLETKPSRRQLFSGFNVHRFLSARNKPSHTTGTFGTYGIDMTVSQANSIHEKKSHSLFSWIGKPLKLPETPIPFHITAFEGENPSYPEKIPLSRKKENLATYTPEQSLIQLLSLTRAGIFKSHVVSKSNLLKKYNFNPLTVNTTGIKEIYSNFQQFFQELSYTVTRTFSEIDRLPEDQRASSKGIFTFSPHRISNYLKDVYLLFDSHKTNHYSTRIAYFTTINQKMEHKREKKREQEYSVPIIQIDKLQDRFIRPVFLRALSTIVHIFGKQEILPSLRAQNKSSSGTKTPISGLREVYINFRQNHLNRNTSVHTETYPVSRESNSPTASKQSYPEFFKYFSVPSIKEILEYSGALYSTSGKNTHATTEQQSILSKTPKQSLANSLLSNIFLSGMPSTSASILSLSKTTGTTFGKTVPVYNLLKYAYSLKHAYSLKSTSSIIYLDSLFATKFGVPSNTQTENSNAKSLMYKPALKYKFNLRSKPVSVLQFSMTQKPDGQKVSCWKTTRMSLSPGGGKRRSSSTETFLQRKPLASLERKNNNLRINIDNPAQALIGQRLFSDIVHSFKPNFTKGMKRKKIIFATSRLENPQQNIQDLFNVFIFKSNILRGSEKTAKSRIHIGSERTDFVFSGVSGAGKPHEITTFGLFGEKRSELTHAGGSNQKTGREGLVYGTSEPLFEEVKKIKRIIFETREIVADHLGSHMPLVTGNPEQFMDIEDMSEKIIQMINRRLKIEAERRGIF